MNAIIEKLEKTTPQHIIPPEVSKWIDEHMDKFSCKRRMLYYKEDPTARNERLVVPASLRPIVLYEAHNGTTAAHLGAYKTNSRIQQYFYWPHMKEDVEKYCQTCMKCATVNKPNHKIKCPLQPLPIASHPGEIISLDLVGPLPISNEGNKYLLVIVDTFTKYPEATPIRDKTAMTVGSVFVEQYITRWGCPRTIATDAGSEFTANFTQQILKLMEIDHRLSTAFIHHSVGAVEKFNQTLLTMLKHYVDKEGQEDWDKHIQKILMAYRCSIHHSTGETPNFLSHGFDLVTITDRLLGVEKDIYADVESYTEYTSTKMKLAWQMATHHIQHAQTKMKKQYDKTAFEPTALRVGS
jgi:hypothetical protein